MIVQPERDDRRVQGEAPAGESDAAPGRTRRPPPWLGRSLWVVTTAAILAPFLLFPVPLEAGDDAGDDVPLASILRAFDQTLAATGWGDAARLLIWANAGLALVAALALLWVAFADEG